MSENTKPTPEGSTPVTAAQVHMTLVFTTTDGRFDHTGVCHVDAGVIACSENFSDAKKDKVYRAIIESMEEDPDGKLHAHGLLWISAGQNVQGQNKFIDVWIEKESDQYPKGRAGWTVDAGTIDMTPSVVNWGLIVWK